ncbi:MAG: hypothetical protein AAGA87_05585 [Pseudomonadota bacterium]
MTQQQYMRRTGIGIGAVGVFFAVSALPLLHPAAHLFLTLAYWPMQSVPPDLVVPLPVLLAISGGLTAGIGAALWALGTHVSPISPAAAMKVAWLMGWSWFIVDSAGSIAVGAPFNAVLNLAFLAPILLCSRVPSSAAEAA